MKKRIMLENRSSGSSAIPVLIIVSISSLIAGPWPGQLPGVEIGAGLPAGYEPSGVVWHYRVNKLFTVWDNGWISMLDYDGSNITTWRVPGDLEAICVADPSTDFAYAGEERYPGDGIWEFDFVSGQITRFFDLTPWMQSNDPNLGLEALTFVPDTANPEGGLFFAGLQENSDIYMFQLPIRSSAIDTHVTYIGMFNPVGGRLNLSGLDYERNTGILYAIWSYGQKKIRAMEVDGTNIVEWDLAGSGDDMEGVALWEGLAPGEAQIFIAEDNPSQSDIWRYDFNSILSLTIVGNGAVNIQPDPPSYYGTSETLTAVPDSGHQFVVWSGDLTGNDNPAFLLMDYDKDVTATFEPAGIVEYQDRRNKNQEPRLEILSNPCHKICNIKYSLPQKTKINLSMYDITGSLVKKLINRTQKAGVYEKTFELADLAQGVYFIRLNTKDYSVTRKIIFIR